MNYKAYYDVIAQEFDTEIALTTIQILTINLSTKFTVKDLESKDSRYSKKILKKAKKVLWEVNADTVKTAIGLWHIHHSWSVSECLQIQNLGHVKSLNERLQDNSENITKLLEFYNE